MSKFAIKIMAGEIPTEQDWNEHLIESHRLTPGQTPSAFSKYLTLQGINSYAILANSLSKHGSSGAEILDLACGDGHLMPYLLAKLGPYAKVTGIDMSEGELKLARQAVKDPRVTFQLAKAQKLPLADHSIDHVFCHMALMLMAPAQPVVQELSRVLKSPGRFSAVMNSRSSTGVYTELRETLLQFLTTHYPKLKDANAGDVRVMSLDGLKQLFNAELGFQIETYHQFELEVHTHPNGVWEFIKDMYFVAMLPEYQKCELKTVLMEFIKSQENNNGKLSFKFPMTLFTAVRQ